MRTHTGIARLIYADWGAGSGQNFRGTTVKNWGTKQWCECRAERVDFLFVPLLVTFWGTLVANDVNKK